MIYIYWKDGSTTEVKGYRAVSWLGAGAEWLVVTSQSGETIYCRSDAILRVSFSASSGQTPTPKLPKIKSHT